MSVLDWGSVERIREAWESGVTQSALATEFGVSLNTISKIVKGQSWTRPQQGVGRKVPPRRLENPDDFLPGLLTLQEQVNTRNRASLPPSLLDGGDAPAETEGSGLSKLNQTLKEMKDEGTL